MPTADGPTAEQIAESEAFIEHEKRRELVESVNADLLQYKRTGNGHFLWRAYATCREAHEPIPDVILRYFDKMASALSQAETAAEIAGALEMVGRPGGSAREKFIDGDRLHSRLRDIHMLVTFGRGMPIRAACEQVAQQHGLNWDSLKRAYNRAKTTKKKRNTNRPVSSVFEWGRD